MFAHDTPRNSVQLRTLARQQYSDELYDIVEAIRVRTGERGPVVLESHEDDGLRADFSL